MPRDGATRTVEELTDPYLDQFTVVPPAGEGVCEVCHGPPGTGYRRCYSCSQTMGQVANPVELVVPASLYEIPSNLHTVLRGYKGPDPTPILMPRVAAFLGRFIHGHSGCITSAAGVQYDTITTVPSSGDRTGPHPLEQVLSMIPWVGNVEPLLSRGGAPITHLTASDQGYEPLPTARGRNVLLIDDTFTTGARSQSAASALHRGGARVVAIVAAGRVVHPERTDYPGNARLWQAARGRRFSFNVCCLCCARWGLDDPA